MSAQAQSFPGIVFDVVQPPVEDKLPRMDIASFVGYASAGPINTPVVVDDMQRFRDVFGKDIDLAWDSDRNQMEKSALGLSVDAFFRNGGRRCWIVRVANEELAQTATFEIPGLVTCNLSDSSADIEKTVANARSPGSEAKKLKVNTALHVTQLPFVKNQSLFEAYFNIDANGWQANLVASEQQLESGDLLSLRPYPNTTLYLIIESVTASVFGIYVTGTRAFLSDEDAEASPSIFDSSLALVAGEGLSGIRIFPISSFESLGVAQALFSNDASAEVTDGAEITSPPEFTMDAQSSVQRLRFEIIVDDNNKQEWRLSQLGFTSVQSRFWGVLPSDEALFQQTEGKVVIKLSDKTQQLIDEANTPRFPLASPFFDLMDDHEWINLPIGMPVFENKDLAVKGDYSEDLSDLLLNGIENAGSSIFLDERLARVGSDSVRREGQSIVYLSENSKPLKGIHSLLTLDEATLISVPDAAHRRWGNEATIYDLPLDAPELIDAVATDVESEYRVQWTPVDEATRYYLEWSESPEFTDCAKHTISGNPLPRVGESIDLIPEPDSECYIKLNSSCPRTFYFRVRAENRNEVSVWSNNIARSVPDTDFVDCKYSRAEPLALNLEINAGPIVSPSTTDDVKEYVLDIDLDWAIVDEASIDTIEVQKSSEFIFFEPDVVFSDTPEALDVSGNLQLQIESQPDSIVYYRARAIRESTIGPWSNTIIVWPSHLSQNVLSDKSDFNDADILAVHRSLLRLCYARGDLFGVLSLPKHYTVQNAQDHYAQLSPTASYDGNVSTNSDTLTATVNPLNIGEKNVCSHGSLYYPWLTTQTESLGQGRIAFQTIPPDGIVSGKISRKSIEQGAWIAPANSIMIDVLALDTQVTRSQWAALMTSKINVIREESRGFLLLSADTLSDNTELKEINVRRLMSMLMRLVHREGNRYVFEPNSASFHERVQQHFESLFNGLFSRGAFSGKKASDAYRVVTDASVNTAQSIESGRFIVELHVAPSHALKFIRVRLVQSGPSQLHVQEVSI